MSKYKRIFIVGHPGAGKALVAKTLAKKLGWQFIDADLGLESRIGRTITEILGNSEDHFHDCQSNILFSQINQENIVVTTDASIVCTDKNRQLLSSEFVVNLKVSTSVQLERTPHNPEPLLPIENHEAFLNQLHHDRDCFYDQVASFSINTDDSELEKHVLSIASHILDKEQINEKNAQPIKDLIIFHKKRHTPVHLSEKQAACVRLLAEGKSSKEIAQVMNLSHRTIEDYIAQTAELLGCVSSKELIALYYDKP